MILCIGLLSPVGDLTSTEVDQCILHFTWTAPYTLQGVPINYYNITITRHSDGAVLGSYTTNTTEFLYSVSRLGETLEVVVAAVNDVRPSNSSNISVQSLSSGNVLQSHIVYVHLQIYGFVHSEDLVSFGHGSS